MQIKTTLRFYIAVNQTPIKHMETHALKNVEQGKYSSTAGWSVNIYNHYEHQYYCFSKSWESTYLKIQLYHFWAYTQRIYASCNGACSTIFIFDLFIIPRNLKQPDVPQQKNGYAVCGTFAQWSIYLVLKNMTS